jgi:hypothetical protein
MCGERVMERAISGMGDEASGEAVRPEIIEGLQAGVAPALALLAGMQLEIFTHLAAGPRNPGALAEALGVAEDRLQRLLYALAALGLLQLRAGMFANAPEAARYLVKGGPDYLGGTHELLAHLWQSDLLTARSIRSGAPAALHDYADASDAAMAAMLRGMHGSALAAGRDLARRADFTACRSVVDIGGGSGGLVTALCGAYPALRGILFDLPRTAALAEDILRTTPGGERVSIETGDILERPPSGLHDAVVLRALVQVLSSADAPRAIAHAAAALRPGGAIYILGGGILDDSRLAPRAAVFLNLTLMNLYRAGGAYTIAEHAAWLAAAGCGAPERIRLPSGGSIIRAERLSPASPTP